MSTHHVANFVVDKLFFSYLRDPRCLCGEVEHLLYADHDCPLAWRVRRHWQAEAWAWVQVQPSWQQESESPDPVRRH